MAWLGEDAERRKSSQGRGMKTRPACMVGQFQDIQENSEIGIKTDCRMERKSGRN
jgi:hypothetical protein